MLEGVQKNLNERLLIHTDIKVRTLREREGERGSERGGKITKKCRNRRNQNANCIGMVKWSFP